MGMPVNTPRAWRFGVFELDASTGELRRNGEVVRLREQPARILLLLLENAGQMVTREQLRQHLWPSNTFVDFDHSLNAAVMKLREALGDSADKPLYIETIPKKGYRFVAPVTVAPARQKAIPSSQSENAIATPALPTGDEHEIEDLWTSVPPDRARERGPASAQTVPGMTETGIAENLETKNELAPGNVTNRRSPLRFAGVGIALAAVLATGLLLYRGKIHSFSHAVESNAANVAPSRMQVSLLTSLPGVARSPALSPDGEKVAFFWNNETPAKWDLYVQLVGDSANPLRLTHTRSGFIDSANWSPDGRQIAFGRCDDNGGGVFVVSALGGPERKLTDVVCPFGDAGYPQWTADGKSLVLADRCTPGAPRGIVLFSLATGEKKCLDTPPAADVGDLDPSLSPDQKTVAFLRSPSALMNEIYTVAVSGGNLHQLTHGAGNKWDPMWSTDGRRIIFGAYRNGSRGVWQVPATGGPIQPELEYPAAGSLSRDGRRLAYDEVLGFSGDTRNIWRAEFARPGESALKQTRIFAIPGMITGTELSSDGRQIAFQSVRSGHFEIWKSYPDGSDPQQITFFDKVGYPGTPRWSPDNRVVAFDYHDPTHTQIYLVDSEGRNLHRITSGNYENVVPSWSRDGSSVYLASNRTGDWQVWKHELSSGREEQVTHHGGFAAFESYDAKTVYYSKFSGGGIWSVPVNGGEEQHLTDTPHVGDWGNFAVTENGLYLVDSSTEPGPTVLYYNFQNRHIGSVLMLKELVPGGASNFASSRDGRTIIYGQFEGKGSILMAEKVP